MRNDVNLRISGLTATRLGKFVFGRLTRFGAAFLRVIATVIVGLLLIQSATAGTYNFNYDELGRLTGVSDGAGNTAERTHYWGIEFAGNGGLHHQVQPGGQRDGEPHVHALQRAFRRDGNDHDWWSGGDVDHNCSGTKGELDLQWDCGPEDQLGD